MSASVTAPMFPILAIMSFSAVADDSSLLIVAKTLVNPP
jgi:hypothetical protein